MLKKLYDLLLYIQFMLFAMIAILNFATPYFGIEHYVVMSGSMEPKIHTGSMAYVKNISDPEIIKEGDIIAFQNGKISVTHRVVDKNDEEKYFITKGDANEKNDVSPVKYEDLIGLTEFTVPYLGYFIYYLQTTSGKLLFLSVIFFEIALKYLIEQFYGGSKDDKSENE